MRVASLLWLHLATAFYVVPTRAIALQTTAIGFVIALLRAGLIGGSLAFHFINAS